MFLILCMTLRFASCHARPAMPLVHLFFRVAEWVFIKGQGNKHLTAKNSKNLSILFVVNSSVDTSVEFQSEWYETQIQYNTINFCCAKILANPSSVVRHYNRIRQNQVHFNLKNRSRQRGDEATGAVQRLSQIQKMTNSTFPGDFEGPVEREECIPDESLQPGHWSRMRGQSDKESRQTWSLATEVCQVHRPDRRSRPTHRPGTNQDNALTHTPGTNQDNTLTHTPGTHQIYNTLTHLEALVTRCFGLREQGCQLYPIYHQLLLPGQFPQTTTSRDQCF